MTYNPNARHNGAKNKRIKTLVAKLVREYLEGRSAASCMDELVKEAKKN